MFDNTDPELEAKAPGALRIALLLAAIVLSWGLLVAGYVFTVRVLIPAFHALGGLI